MSACGKSWEARGREFARKREREGERKNRLVEGTSIYVYMLVRNGRNRDAAALARPLARTDK